MQLIKKESYIRKRERGRATLIPNTREDMLHVYNLIAVKDILHTIIRRRNYGKGDDATTGKNGKTEGSVEFLSVVMWIRKIDYDCEASEIQIKGTIKDPEEDDPDEDEDGEPVTCALKLERRFTVEKFYWDTVAIQRLNIALRQSNELDVAAVIMQEGLAHICVVSKFMTRVVAKIEYKILSKRMGTRKHEQGLNKFYDLIQKSMLRHINVNATKCILLASPGFVNDHFLQYMMEKTDDKTVNDMKNDVLLRNRNKFLLAYCSSGFKHSLNEVLMCKDPAISRTLEEKNAISEMRVLEEFYDMLHTDANKAYYGLKHVEYAFSLDAVKKLIISDALFLTEDRQKYVELAERVQMEGNELCILSSFHASGEQLEEFAGIAVILQFPIPEPEEDSEDE